MIPIEDLTLAIEDTDEDDKYDGDGGDDYDNMWGLVMKAFPKRYQKSDALQVQLCWVGARRSERWDP